MKRYFLFTVAVILSAFSLTAQNYISYKEYHEGLLTADDFSKRGSTGDLIGQVYTGINTYSGDWEKVQGNLRVKRLKSVTVFDPIRSWVRSDTLTDQAVRYGQLIFDATELTRRQMENHLAAGKYDTNYHMIIQRYFDVNEAVTDEIERVTERGRDIIRLEQQEQIIAEELANLQDFSGNIPEYSLRKLYVGAYLGAASQFHLGNSASYFGPGYGFIYGFEGGYGRSAIHWDMVMGGGPKLKKNVPGDDIPTWLAGENAFYGEMSLQYAYNVYDSDWFRISPFVGLGIGFIDYNNPDYGDGFTKDEIAGMRYVGGVCVDFKFRRSLYLVGDTVWSSIYGGLNENSLRLKVYLTHTSYNNGMSPYTLNCSLCFNLLSKYMKP